MNKFSYITLFTFLLVASGLKAQFTLSGTVLNEKGEPVPEALVSGKEPKIQTSTDVNGAFTLKFEEKATIEIQVKAFGFSEYSE